MSLLGDEKVYLFASLFLMVNVLVISACGPSPRNERAALNRRVNAMLADLKNEPINRRVVGEYFADRVPTTKIKRNRGLLIHRLQEVKNQEPEFSDGYSTAVYDSAEFVKQEGTWYLESVDR